MSDPVISYRCDIRSEERWPWRAGVQIPDQTGAAEAFDRRPGKDQDRVGAMPASHWSTPDYPDTIEIQWSDGSTRRTTHSSELYDILRERRLTCPSWAGSTTGSHAILDADGVEVGRATHLEAS